MSTTDAPIALSVAAFMQQYSLSLSSVYRLINAGQLAVRRMGPKKTLIDAQSAKAWYESLPSDLNSDVIKDRSAAKKARRS